MFPTQCFGLLGSTTSSKRVVGLIIILILILIVYSSPLASHFVASAFPLPIPQSHSPSHEPLGQLAHRSLHASRGASRRLIFIEVEDALSIMSSTRHAMIASPPTHPPGLLSFVSTQLSMGAQAILSVDLRHEERENAYALTTFPLPISLRSMCSLAQFLAYYSCLCRAPGTLLASPVLVLSCFSSTLLHGFAICFPVLPCCE